MNHIFQKNFSFLDKKSMSEFIFLLMDGGINLSWYLEGCSNKLKFKIVPSVS